MKKLREKYQISEVDSVRSELVSTSCWVVSYKRFGTEYVHKSFACAAFIRAFVYYQLQVQRYRHIRHCSSVMPIVEVRLDFFSTLFDSKTLFSESI